MYVREFRLTIDGGPLKPMPVRCGGYIDEGAFHIESVWVDVGDKSYDIYENLKPHVLASLEEQAEDEIVWEKA
jgi:hypothetical protein